MKSITIHKTDFDINDIYSIDDFNCKLQEISESFEVKFNYPITEIPAWLFSGTNLAKIELPNSVTEINSWAFANCKSLTKVTLPNAITKIGSFAFSDCASLTEINLPLSIEYLDKNILYNCPRLNRITVLKSREDFLKTVTGAKVFFEQYGKSITFKEPTIEMSQSKAILKDGIPSLTL